MERTRVRGAMLGWLLAITTLAAPVVAQGPGSVLVYPRFKTDQKMKTIGRITNTGSSTEVALLLVCPGDSQGFCPFLVTTFELERNATRVFNVNDFDPPCKEGYFVALGESGDELIGSYEIFKGKVGKLREADNAVAFASGSSPIAFGEVLVSDYRATSGKVGSELVLLDLLVADRILDEEDQTGPMPSQQLEITGTRDDGSGSFTVNHEFTCFERVKLERLNSRFGRGFSGDYGSITIRALEREDERRALIMGAMCEKAKGSQSTRSLFDMTPTNESGGIE